MRTYQVKVARADRWWMITVPELDGYVRGDGSINVSDTTQARRRADVAREARGFICTVTNQAPSQVDLEIAVDRR
ncbi:hypothetical protein [Mycolicibacterium holsaticum]|uniref:Uncharacterized protein n=1 Tax=Mycolicibacterium holsaticum TaxID=152142 RepID=A0A1E3R4Q3_9MYCO|nr:hypothetical protein [Mycolicibacterium holsaticum]ODQ84906.1 hypothetical protein BHQ17_25325 [Mycolicibacterium holsaticum]